MNSQEISFFHRVLFLWYRKQGRHDLPWRKTDDLYAITVSEIMLQQTNVPKVIEKYQLFLERFPDWFSLSRASQSSVVHAWEGLGYNRRALYLHKMAKVVCDDFGGELPENPDVLKKMPGMGPYTRHAVLVFGRNRDFLALDVNLIRVFGRWLGGRDVSVHGEEITYRLMRGSLKKHVQDLSLFLPRGKSRKFHNAMMDFASLICTKRRPKCFACPLKNVCQSYPVPFELKHVKKKEPGRMEQGKFVPRRIFRGRIVSVLRSGSSGVSVIGKKIKRDWQVSADSVWLEDLLARLVKDGVVEKVGRKWQLVE
ncbi:MAG: A/G-specific adenine glycosylase [Candidatus Moranbacteria bacterium]|nr:A/G-specific adenine glycosylase [Candidatus Moranbacteria bacterium]